MMRRRWRWTLAGMVLFAGLLLAPWWIAWYWQIHSSNAVRRGMRRARELGCFSCHSAEGREGIPDPGTRGPSVPAWVSDWSMYVLSEEEVRTYILEGQDHRNEGSAIPMPAYRAQLHGSDLNDLVAAFQVISGMRQPPPDSAAQRGARTARRWGCFSCHGAGASGGLPNPGSLTGFIPGWYGADFKDLVRSRQEFDEWISTGSSRRFLAQPLATFFMNRQRLKMPAYENLSHRDLDDLWAYSLWLAGNTPPGSPPAAAR